MDSAQACSLKEVDADKVQGRFGFYNQAMMTETLKYRLFIANNVIHVTGTTELEFISLFIGICSYLMDNIMTKIKKDKVHFYQTSLVHPEVDLLNPILSQSNNTRIPWEWL